MLKIILDLGHQVFFLIFPAFFCLRLRCLGICNCNWNPQIVSRIRMNLRNPEQLPTFARCGIQWSDKNYVTGIFTQNPLKFCKWNALMFWNMIKDLSLESRNTQTQYCAPIQCTVRPRNVACNFFLQKTFL